MGLSLPLSYRAAVSGQATGSGPSLVEMPTPASVPSIRNAWSTMEKLIHDSADRYGPVMASSRRIPRMAAHPTCKHHAYHTARYDT
jgi:hypothetical protein